LNFAALNPQANNNNPPLDHHHHHPNHHHETSGNYEAKVSLNQQFTPAALGDVTIKLGLVLADSITGTGYSAVMEDNPYLHEQQVGMQTQNLISNTIFQL
jgi:hypothetical protein